jgi:nucleoside-diphosphate kinase
LASDRAARAMCASLPSENIIHTSDSPKTAIEEIERFFKPEELFEYERAVIDFVYYPDEYKLT